MPRLDLRLPVLLAFALSLLVSAFAELPSQNPADYDIDQARQDFRSAEHAYDERNREILEIRRQVGAKKKEIGKLSAQNERLAKVNPSHPKIARNQSRIAKLRAEIPVLQRKLPHLEKALIPFASKRDASKQRLNTIERNIERAEDHLRSLAEDLAQVAREFAYDRGSLDGERDGNRAGAETGRAIGEQLGIYNARSEAVEIGQRLGTQEGTSAGASEAVKLAYESGEADAWEEKGYADGYETSFELPEKESLPYANAFENGRQRAQNDAYAHYLPGVKRADAFYRSQQLSENPSPNLEYNAKARPWVPLTKQSVAITRQSLRPVPFETRKASSLPVGAAPDFLKVERVDDSLPIPEIVIEFHSHIFEPRGFPFVRVPTQGLHNFFERKYRDYYQEVSRREYEQAYARNFDDSFHWRAEEQIRIFSNPSLYHQIAEETERLAFDHYFEVARAETFNRDYFSLYQQIREKAFRSPDTESVEYQTAYQDGRYNALITRGEKDGYQENFQAFKTAEEARGFQDRDKYYKQNAVLDGPRFRLQDENRDGVFAINEPFDLSLDLRNIGLATQGPEQFEVRLRVVSGPAFETRSEHTLAPLAPQSRISLDRLLSGRIYLQANVDQTVKVHAELLEFGRVIHNQTFSFPIDYPLELSHVDHPIRLFSNQQNKTIATLENPTTQTTPSEIDLRLTDTAGRVLAEQTLPNLQSRSAVVLELDYLLDAETEFSRQDLALELISNEVVQLRYRFPRTFVSKRYAKESELLILLENATTLDLLPMKEELERKGLGFDLYAKDQEKFKPDQTLIQSYEGGYIVANLGRNPDADTARNLQSFFKAGGSLLVASPNFSRSEDWVNFLPQFGLKLVDKSSTQTMRGLSVLEGENFRNQFTASSRLSLQSPQKNVISYPLIRSDKRRGFGGATFHATRSLHPLNLNTFSIASFPLETLRPGELARLVSELLLANQSLPRSLDQLADANRQRDARKQASRLKTRLLEAHTLASRLKDKSHKAAALEHYETQLKLFIDFAYDHAGNALLRPHLSGIVSELSRKRHAGPIRSELKALSKSLK